MPRPKDAERVKQKQGWVNRANVAFESWEKKFKCDTLEALYDGTGHWDAAEDPEGKKYVINRVFSSVETRTPTLLFYRPKARIVPRPTRSDDPGSLIDERAMLLEDHADTLVADERVGYMDATTGALHDANFYFGVVEIGYSNNWIDNPNAGKPVLVEGKEIEGTAQPDRVPPPEGAEETMYVKQIPPEDFRVPINAGNKRLDQLDWYAYREWHYLEDVKRNPIYKNTSGLKATGQERQEYAPGEQAEGEHAKMVRLWKLWDNRAKKRYVWAEGHDKFLLEEAFTIGPHEDLRFHKARKGWYPIPPVYQWRSPQREHNEVRQDMRDFRRGSMPRYTYRDGAIDQNELEKLESGGPFTVAKANAENPLTEVPRSEGRMNALRTAIPDTREDFNEISSIPAEHRGVSDAETATQASIIDINARVRESADREKVAKFLARVIKKMLLISKEKMALSFWIKLHVDPLGPEALRETLRVVNGWAQITHKDLGDFEWDVSVDVEALSPATEDLRRNQWLNFIGVMGTPGALPVLASETLLKKTAAYFGIRSAREVAEIKQSVLQALMVQAGMQAMQKGGGVSGFGGAAAGGQTPAVPQPIPSQEQTQQQMTAQGVGIQ